VRALALGESTAYTAKRAGETIVGAEAMRKDGRALEMIYRSAHLA
jgi:hypothetical protein